MTVVLFVLAFYGIAMTGVFIITHGATEDVVAENKSLRRHIAELRLSQHTVTNVVPLRGLDEVSEEWLG